MSKKPQAKPVKKTLAQPEAQPTLAGDSMPLQNIAALVVAALALFLYINTFGHGYVLDDDLVMSKHPNVVKGLAGIPKIFTSPFLEGNLGGELYRPVPVSLFALEWWISPNNPSISHMMNVLWYVLTCVSVFFMLREWFRAQNVLLPFAAALLFTAHPIHTEVVANIKSRDEIMSLLGCVVALWQWGRYLRTSETGALLSAVLAYGVALFSKEGSVAMLPMFPIVAWVLYGRDVRGSLMPVLPILVPFALYFAMRAMIFGSAADKLPDIMDNPIIQTPGLIARMPTAFAVLAKYFGLLLWPNPLSSDYSYTVIPLASWGDLRALAGLAIYGGLAGLTLWGLKSRHIWSIFSTGFLGGLILYSQLPLIIGTMFGERLAYTSSLFFCAGVVYLLFRVLKPDTESPMEKLWSLRGKQIPAMAVVGLVVLVFGYLSIGRNRVWSDNFSLFTTDSATYPKSVRLHNGSSSEYYNRIVTDTSLTAEERQTYMNKAEAHLDSSLAIRPTTTAYLNKGNNRLYLQQHDDAIAFYRKSLEVLPGYDIANRNLAIALRDRGKIQGEINRDAPGAQKFLEESYKLNPNDATTTSLLGVAYAVQGQLGKAVELLEKSYAMAPTPQTAGNLAQAYSALGNAEKANFYKTKTGQ